VRRLRTAILHFTTLLLLLLNADLLWRDLGVQLLDLDTASRNTTRNLYTQIEFRFEMCHEYLALSLLGVRGPNERLSIFRILGLSKTKCRQPKAVVTSCFHTIGNTHVVIIYALSVGFPIM